MTTLSSPDPVGNIDHCPKCFVFFDSGLVVKSSF